MAKALLVFIFTTFLFTPTFAQQPGIAAIEDSEGTILNFNLGSYELTELETPWGLMHTVQAEGATPLLEKGAPDLPKFHTSVILDETSTPTIEVLSSSYTDLQDIDIAPSKGNFTRDISPSAVPMEKGHPYQVNAFWPSAQTMHREPYILRDYRGMAVIFQPFSYNPQTRTLRVYHSISVRIHGSRDKNAGISESDFSGEFNHIYKRHFINYPVTPLAKTSGNTVSEDGKLLIICQDAFLQEMQAFVNWKKQRGLRTEMVAMSTVGSTAADIEGYVSSYYLNQGLTYLLLVGDHAYVPAAVDGFGNYSDNHYGYLEGQDYYPEIFVGRFSAENLDHVQTQVQRSIDYEKSISQGSDWLAKAVGIASSEGPGDDNEYDYQHIRNIGNDLRAFTYSEAAELFEGSQGGFDATGNPNAAQLTSLLNSGAGIINYTGHGASYCSVTTGFSSTNVLALDNAGKLPWFWSVACSNGEFMFGTCYAENWLRATKNGAPTGAVGTLMATILQSWAPPMEGQDEMNLILTETYQNKIKRTFTGISMHGCMSMNDAYGNGGYEMTSTWTTFGDPSLMVRTDNPGLMTVTHVPLKSPGTTSLTVNSNTEDALIALTVSNQIIGTGKIANGTVTITFPALNAGDTVLVTATAFNKETYTGTVKVIEGADIPGRTAKTFSLYPNPVNSGEMVQVDLPEDKPAQISVNDMIGKLILSAEHRSGSRAVLQTSGMPTGMYFVTVTQNGSKYTGRITIR